MTAEHPGPSLRRAGTIPEMDFAGNLLEKGVK